MAGFRLGAVALAALVFVGCSAEPAAPGTGEDSGPPPDAQDAPIGAPGKADSPFSACEVDGALLFASDPAVDVAALRAVGVHSTSAKHIVAAKSGVDGVLGTEDDVSFRTLAELDAVYWVGPAALSRLTSAVAEHCADVGAYPSVSAIFSPQPWASSHLAKSVELIDGAKRSIDVAMYSFSDKQILAALGRAKERGVLVRVVFEPARDEAKNPAGTMSASIEQKGIDVRFVNKIMHHKYMIVDGPQESSLEALGTTLVTGSANWSNSGGTRYDENTVVARGVPELALSFQREFNLMWETSRDFVNGTAFEPVLTLPVANWMLLEDSSVDAHFTSANFDVFVSSLGPGFSTVSGRNAVSDRLVELIQSAEKSILVASGHLRSRPVAEALLAKRAENPNLEIRIYLDGQEYISEYTNVLQEKDLAACLEKAGDSVSKQQACVDKGFYFSYPMVAAGIDLRFKHYSYRWHYTYAEQMHHKYLIVDDETLATGSYNLSDNAEHQTLENMVFYRDSALVDAFVENFDGMWVTGEADGLYESLLNEVQNGTGPVPIVYPSMALTWAEVTTLKEAIRDACVDVDSEDFRAHPEKHFTCSR